MKTIRISDFTSTVIEHHKSGTSKGVDTGFRCLDELLSFKLGYSTYFLGFAGAGKTELHMEMLFNLSERYGWRHVLLSAEIGETKDVIAELISKRLRKPFFQSNPYSASEKEIYQAINWLDEHFFPVDSSLDYSVDKFYDYAKQVENEIGGMIHTTSIDPWNDMEEDLSKFGNREDKYLTWALRHSRQVAAKNNWHNFIVTHARDMPPIALKSVNGGEVYNTAIPTLQSFAGGQVWGRRAMNVVGVWRPEKGSISPETGLPFDDSEAIVLVLKSKPKGTGKKGKCSLFFDWKTNRYYEKIDGALKYAFQHELSRNYMQPNLEFENSVF